MVVNEFHYCDHKFGLRNMRNQNTTQNVKLERKFIPMFPI